MLILFEIRVSNAGSHQAWLCFMTQYISPYFYFVGSRAPSEFFATFNILGEFTGGINAGDD
jgi:hypothetical protein